MASIAFSRDIPVRHEVDVFVAGGGPAGIAAALAARHQNASVFLAEGTFSCLGGMGTAGMVPAVLQIRRWHQLSWPAGVGRTVYERMFSLTRPPGPTMSMILAEASLDGEH